MATVMGGIGVPQIARAQTGESTEAESAELDQNGQLTHDTLVTGPWAEGAILGGAAFVAVKNEVQVSMEFRHLNIDQAKALMAYVMEKL